MPIIDYWHREPVLDEPFSFELYMRTTPSFRGLIIDPPRRANRWGDGEYSPRRYSVILKMNSGQYRLIIGSVSYMSDGFDTEDVEEPFEKFLNGSFHILFDTIVSGDDMDYEIDSWNGSSQQLQSKFGYYVADPTWPIDTDSDLV